MHKVTRLGGRMTWLFESWGAGGDRGETGSWFQLFRDGPAAVRLEDGDEAGWTCTALFDGEV